VALEIVERWVRWIGAVAVLAALTIALLGLWRGLHRPRGRATGVAHKMLRSPVFLLIGIGYFGFCFVLWRPLPLTLSPLARVMALVLGGLLYFPGLALYLWARQTLGQLYNASCGFGAQLHADHQLVTWGPFALVRHPIYLAVLIVALGGTLIYRTWTFVFNVIMFLGLVRRAQREEEVLAVEFGEQWQVYCRQVPAWVPRLWRQVK
jgi:protein-S-isoprenylcysteine O-methyltransferase Ste14